MVRTGSYGQPSTMWKTEVLVKRKRRKRRIYSKFKTDGFLLSI
jgi:hypothetical protein